MINPEYLGKLVNHSRTELEKNYNIADLGFDDFEIINFFLINKTLNQDSFNLAITLPQRDDKRDFYIPVLLSVGSTLFFQNYVDDKTNYNVGEIVQKDGKRFKITKKTDAGYIILSDDQEKTEKFPTTKGIKKYIVTTANLSARQSKVKFNHYRNLFKLIFGEEYVPSKFSYKTAIILEKNEFLETLKTEKIPEIELKKAIPFKWITKKGLGQDESDYIPIEPMIYLLPDYETFKEFVFDKIEHLDSVIFIGKNKYEPHLSHIKRDLRKGHIPKAIFIGSKEIDGFTDLKTWKWTQAETNYFNDIDNSDLDFISVKPVLFLENLKKLEDRITQIDEDYCFNIKSLFRLKKILYSTTFPSFSSRLSSQIEYTNHIYTKEIRSAVSESFLEINEDPEPYIKELIELFRNLICSITTDKFQRLTELNKINILIVPERFIETWDEDLKNGEYKEVFRKTKIYSFKEFKQHNASFTKRKNVALLSLFGYADFPIDILRTISHSSNNFSLILYPEEKELAEKLLARCQNEIMQEFCSEDRYSLCKLEYPLIKKDEDISDIISRFFEQENFESTTYRIDHSEHVEYEITFDNDEKDILEGSRTVLLSQHNLKRKEKVANLIPGDSVRVYENTSRERLFRIATENDAHGKLHDIIENSKLWKRCLQDYFLSVQSQNYGPEELINELHNNGAKIQLLTLKKWLDIEERDLFPAQTINLIAIKRTINCKIFDSKFDEIKHSKKAYRSIMIALGRDLSDEIMDYIISDKKVIGKILSQFSKEQIAEFINTSAPLHKIKKLEILESCDYE
jgi:hypothetical protein